MNRIPVVVPPEVKQLIGDQVRYIARHSVDNALAWEDRVPASLDSLGEFYSHAVDDDASRRVGQSLGKLLFEKTYLIHYRVQADTVQVVGFRHGARLPREGEP